MVPLLGGTARVPVTVTMPRLVTSGHRERFPPKGRILSSSARAAHNVVIDISHGR